MVKYLIKRLITGLLSAFAVVAIVMLLVYGLLDRKLIFSSDERYTKIASNAKEEYLYEKWEDYGYVDYISYSEWIGTLIKSGELTEEQATEALKTAETHYNSKGKSLDTGLALEYADKFQQIYEEKGWTVVRLDRKKDASKSDGRPKYFAYRNRPLIVRFWEYFTSIITIDNIHNASGIEDSERGIKFYFNDPVYGGDKFSPCIIGNGTTHKYLLYCDDQFPFIHQNLVTITLGTSYSVKTGVDVWTTMTTSQGSIVQIETVYPTGLVEMSADDLHTAVYQEGSLNETNVIVYARFVDDYTSTTARLNGNSKMGFSFTIGIISVCLAYILGIPLGLAMARNKEKLIDKIGTVYIVFIIAVPSLAYIFMFKGIGSALFGLPTTFDVDKTTQVSMYILPVISLALPSVANLMKWSRRYMIDQMNSDYVKFARSGGLSETEIFSKHILKNAIIPIVHGIPASVLGALTGAIITERVYAVPGVGNVLTEAINKYDNAVIVGVSLFYAILSVVAVILGDLLMATVDPRISFTDKGR